MPTYIKCTLFKAWNPAEDVKKRNSTAQDVVPEGFSNYSENDTQQNSGVKQKCGVSYGDLVCFLFPFFPPLLNGLGKTLHRLFGKYFSCRPSKVLSTELKPASSTAHHHGVALLSDPAHAADQEYKEHPYCTEQVKMP